MSAVIHDTSVNFNDQTIIFLLFIHLNELLVRIPVTEANPLSISIHGRGMSDLSYYCYVNNLAFHHVNMPDVCDCTFGCHNAADVDVIKVYLENIVAAVHQAVYNAMLCTKTMI